MKFRLAILLLLAQLMAGCAQQARQEVTFANEAIGQVQRVTGQPVVIRGGQEIGLRNRDDIRRGDRILTGSGRIHVRMRDDTVIELGEASTFTFDQYYFSPQNARAVALMTFDSGTLKTSTGRLMQAANPTFEIRTPLAVIGVRGTVFWGGFIFGDNSLDVAMLSGKGIYVQNALTSVDINTAGQGITVQATGMPSQAAPWSKEKVAIALATTEI